MTWQLIQGETRAELQKLEPGSVHTVVTSPPYFGLRDYGTGEWEGGAEGCDHTRPSSTYNDGFNERWGQGAGQRKQEHKNDGQYRDVCADCGAQRVDRQIGLEPTPDEYVQSLVQVFREVRRVLRDDGTVWLNLGDSYSGAGATGRNDEDRDTPGGRGGSFNGGPRMTFARGGKPKDLLGIPWMVAFALRADGWYLRSDIIWAKPNPMPESVTDRPTKSHEYLFLLSKGPRYFYDADAIREALDPATADHHDRYSATEIDAPKSRAMRDAGFPMWQPRNGGVGYNPAGRNKRSVWTVATQPYAGAHFATFPPALIKPCILAGAPERACSVCGAPWERIQQLTAADGRTTTRAASVRAGVDDTGRALNADNSIDRGNRGSFTATRGVLQRETVGFQPSCTHDAPTTPGVVLDPFSGAGTTALVADRLNRHGIGIELNPTYHQLAWRRLHDDAPLLGMLDGHEDQPPTHEQLPLTKDPA